MASQLAHWSKKTLVCRRHRRPGLDFWVRKIPWKRKRQPTPVFLLGEYRGLRSLAGYSPWDLEELDMTERPAHTQLWTSLVGMESKNSMFLLGARSWAFGISFRGRAALRLCASSFSQLSGFPHWPPDFRAAVPCRGLTALARPAFVLPAPGWPHSFPRAQPSAAFFQETAAAEKGHCCSGGRWLERLQ